MTHFPLVKTFLTVLVVLAMLGTVGVLFAGLFGLVSGNQDGARSNKLMRYRVLLQGVALLLFVVLLSLLKN
jgi:NADH:ubiquinone oxidoreductase subunit 6 (subunit J)